MRTTTQLAEYFDLSSAKRLNDILKDLKIQRKDKFERWVFIDPEHKKYERYKEVINKYGKSMAVRVFTDEGKAFIEKLLIENNFYKKPVGSGIYEEYLLRNRKYKNRFNN